MPQQKPTKNLEATTNMKSPVRVAITGAAGNIGYAMAFRIAAGDMLGPDQPVILHLIEIEPALPALNGVVMELLDCAFPLLNDITATSDLTVGFQDVDYALLVGAKPRGPGMERSDLLNANGAIFGPQGKAINDHASENIKVLVVGNPANTNALIAQSHAPDRQPQQFTSMMRLDHNRAIGMLSAKTGIHVQNIKKLVVWGNHSLTQFPDISQCIIEDTPALDLVDKHWYHTELIPKVQQRGAEVIKARGASSAASAASAAIDHMRTWALGTPTDDWTSMAVPSDGSYDIAPGVIFSFPVTCQNGAFEIVQGLHIDEFSRQRIDSTYQELQEERNAIAHLLLD